MVKYKTIRKSLFVILLSFLFVCVLSLVFLSTGVAKAGNVNDTLIKDGFDTDKFDEAKWVYDGNKEGVVFNKVTNTPKLLAEEPIDGSHILSTVPVTSDKIRVQIDIKRLDFGDDAWLEEYDKGGGGRFCLAYNVADIGDGVPYKAINDRSNAPNCDGIYLEYSQRQNRLLFSTLSGKISSFVDASNVALPRADEYKGSSLPVYDASMITDIVTGEGSQIITNKTITFIIGDGNLEIYVKSIGESGDGVLVAKHVGGQFPKLLPQKEGIKAQPYVAIFMSAADSQNLQSAEITEFKISDAENPETVFNSFTEQTMSQYRIFKSKKTKLMNFSLDNKMSLNNLFSTSKPLLILEPITVNEKDDFHSYYQLSGEMIINSLAKKDVVYQTTPTEKKYAKDAKFGILAGAKKTTSAKIGESESTYVYFVKDVNSTSVGIDTYHKPAEGATTAATTLLAPTEITLGSDNVINYNLKVTNKGRLTLVINGVKMYESQVDGEAYGIGKQYIGYALSGSNENFSVDMYSAKLDNLYYERPENSNIVATFDDDVSTTDIDESNAYNKDEWYLRSSPFLNVHSNTAYVREGQLTFENCASGSMFATQRQYSDFEMQLDITDVRREVVKDSNGNKNYPISAWIGIYWGVPYASLDFGQGVGSTYPLVYIGPEVDQQTWGRRQKDGKDEPLYIRCMGFGMDKSYPLPEHYDYWDLENAQKVLQFKVMVIENNVTISLKYKDETEWYEVGSLETKASIVGNVALTTMGCNIYREPDSVGATCGYFSADNIMVSNLDNNGNIVSIPFVTSKVPLQTDYDYQDPGNNDEYLIPKEKSGCNSSLNPSVIAVWCITLAATLVVIKMVRRSRQ